MLVEDNAINRLVATATLGRYGAKITEAVNGIEAVEAIKSSQVDLVLMDMQMPVMDGLEATTIIRNEIGSDVPIIALTANAIKGESDKCYEAGMNDFISKPFKEEELVRVIAKWLGKNVSIAVAGKPVAAAGQLYNLSQMHEISNGDNVFFKKIITLFISEAGISLEEIHAANQGNDFNTIKAVVHRIKPTIENMGIASLQNNVRQIEKLAILNKPSDELNKLIEELDTTLKNVIESLQAAYLKAVAA